MLKVFICEDNDMQRDKVTKYIENNILIEGFDMEVALSTSNPKEVIDYLSKNGVHGLYFLDIDLNTDINGITLAAEIRKYDPVGCIVFITTMSEMSLFTFKYRVEAMDYIIKDNYYEIQERIRNCMIDASKRYSEKTTNLKKNFTIKINDRIMYLPLDEILFFETSSERNWIIVHAVDRQIRFYSSMKEIEEKLDSRFYRCHKSYILNKDNIKEVDLKNKIAYMKNGGECLISGRLIKGLVSD